MNRWDRGWITDETVGGLRVRPWVDYGWDRGWITGGTVVDYGWATAKCRFHYDWQ